MKERPFAARQSEVRGILDGTLTELMRPIKPQPELGKPWKWWIVDPLVMDIPIALCPYGIPGDRLWVRETWRQYDRWNECECYDFCYCPPTGTVIYRSDRDDDEVKWRPSIHMPRWASRITLEVTDVRVEHVQEISAERVIGRSANPWVWVVEFVASEDWR